MSQAEFKLEELKRQVTELKRPITTRTHAQQGWRHELLLEAEAELKEEEEHMTRLKGKVEQDKVASDER